uniref:Exocyst complex component Sec3 PIP2-binding N-terminal domain-containing protein n=1 Tax=Terrapene triunguis TaxID=2587831 RepID=A0A674IPK8_9SAUR
STAKDVFNPQNERLLEIVHVWKTGKKRKNSILCVAGECPGKKVKKADRGDQYKMTDRWPLKDLKLVDGKNVNQECLEFELQFDKVYKWTAVSADEKNAFIRCLWKLNRRYLSSSIAFVSIPSCMLEGKQSLQEVGNASAKAGDQAEHSAYQEMTPKETADMLKLMEEYEPIVNNSMAFAEKLSKELQVLDEANLQAIISSEKQVTLLMGSIDEALAEVAKVEETLQVYDELLGSVKQQMDHIQQGNSLLHQIDSNHEKLMSEILFLTSNLDLSKKHRQALSRGDLSSPSKVKACIAAAEALSSCMNVQIQPGYRKLQAIAEQLIMFETLKQNFENSFISHITSIFELQHFLPHSFPFQVYAWNLSRLYEREIKAFFELARMLLLGRTKECNGVHRGIVPPSPSPNYQFLGWVFPSHLWVKSSAGANWQSSIACRGVMLIYTRWTFTAYLLLSFGAVFELHLPVSFCHPVHTSLAGPLPEQLCPNPLSVCDTYSRLEEQPTQLLSEIFSSLEPELRGFIDTCNKVQQFSCLQVLVTLNDYMFEMQGSSAATSSSFLNVGLSNILLLAKNNFNKCIVSQTRQSQWAKGGILPFVSRFEEFVNFSEDVFRWAQRRGELDKAHTKLVGSVFINSLASANLKVNTDMVMMENFHHIHCFLYQKKIQCLESKRREAKQRYREHLERYVTKYLGQPLEKLNHFFEGVKARVAQGVKEEEVSFQLAYSKQELRKVIEKYPGKEVKRALDTLYRKIHKYLSPEENLLPVVWRAMEQEFIRQYQEFENLIQRCYPGSGITMDFTVEDLLNYFISITQSSM